MFYCSYTYTILVWYSGAKKCTANIKKIWNYNVVIFQSDIRKISRVRDWVKNHNFNAIFHLASLVSVKLCNENPLKACSINIGGTNNILKSIKKLDKKPWLFYASTSHVYKLEKTPISETDNISPRTFYGYTKWMGEKIFENINLEYIKNKIFNFNTRKIRLKLCSRQS